MSEHLEKAKGALQAAADMEVELGQATLPRAYVDLLHHSLTQVLNYKGT